MEIASFCPSPNTVLSSGLTLPLGAFPGSSTFQLHKSDHVTYCAVLQFPHPENTGTHRTHFREWLWEFSKPANVLPFVAVSWERSPNRHQLSLLFIQPFVSSCITGYHRHRHRPSWWWLWLWVLFWGLYWASESWEMNQSQALCSESPYTWTQMQSLRFCLWFLGKCSNSFHTQICIYLCENIWKKHKRKVQVAEKNI